MRMGTPSSERNCFGCGPAIRVPRPAAGRIANTCITRRVYILPSGGGSDCDCSHGDSLVRGAYNCRATNSSQRILMMRTLRALIAAGAILAAGIAVRAQNAEQGQAPTDSCSKLASLVVPNASVTVAKGYASGTFAGPRQA